MLSYHTAFSPYPYKTTLHYHTSYMFVLYTPWSDQWRQKLFLCALNSQGQATWASEGSWEVTKNSYAMLCTYSTQSVNFLFNPSVPALCVLVGNQRLYTDIDMIPTFNFQTVVTLGLSPCLKLPVSQSPSNQITSCLSNVNSIFWSSRLTVFWPRDLPVNIYINYITRKFQCQRILE